MVKVKNIEDLLAEQAVRKAITCYSRGVDRSDLDLLKSAFHDDAEVKYGSYDGHHAEFCKIVVDGQADMDYTTHTVVNEYYEEDPADAVVSYEYIRVKGNHSPTLPPLDGNRMSEYSHSNLPDNLKSHFWLLECMPNRMTPYTSIYNKQSYNKEKKFEL